VRRGVHECCGHVEIVGDVCPVVNEATRLDDAGEQFCEGCVEDTAFVMSCLPPWIGEVDMCGVN